MILKEMTDIGSSDFGGDPSADAYSKLVSSPSRPLDKILFLLNQSKQDPRLIRAYHKAVDNFYQNGVFDPQSAVAEIKPILIHIATRIAPRDINKPDTELGKLVRAVGKTINQI